MRIWTDDDVDAAHTFSRVWRWRVYGMLLIAAVVVAYVLLSRT